MNAIALGFYTQELLEYLELKKLNYIIVTRMYPNVKNAIGGLDNWVELTQGIYLKEMMFNHNDKEPRRYIVVRKKIEDRPKASGNTI